MRLHANPTNVFTGNWFPQLKTISNVSFEVLWEFVGLPLINLRYARFSAWKQELGTDSWVELSVMESTTRLRSATNVPSLEVYFRTGTEQDRKLNKTSFHKERDSGAILNQCVVLGVLMDLYNETHCVNCSCSWAFMELAREVWAICLELKRAALAMPIALLQINYSVVAKSQAIADNAHLMNLGVNLITTVTSVSLARMVYGAYQNVGHQWILNRVLQ